ncbi:MAG: D-glycerate dehydrogenase [Thaumarchaeota archaeon]|nr:D-glycerate dehydrogenase [Nitrososphaerota archaeon]MDE1838657.1 D-glycerate dehydrogenase [Nitrososphaerota archaeon]
MKILLTRKLHDFALKELKKRYHVEVHAGSIPMPKKLLISKIKDKDGLICYPYDSIDSDVINAATRLKAISTYSVGYDHIDIKTASKRDLVIGYTPEVLTRATADLTMALMLSLLRKIPEGDKLVRDNKWKTVFGPYEFLGTDLYQKTLGILGMGRIGKAVAQRASGFEMNVIYHNRTRLTKKEEEKLGARYVSLESLFKTSDILSIHSPHTPQTHKIINLKLLKKMKRTAFLINTSRGKIINEKDLVIALKKKIISGAGLDVFQKEPIDSTNPITKLDNVILMPHSGSATTETRKKMAEIAVKNLVLGLAGKKMIYQVKM